MPSGWVIQLLTAGVCAFGIMMYFFHLRTKFQKQAQNHVLCEFITEEGTSYKKLLEVKDGFVHLKGNEKKKIPDKNYPTAGNASYLTDYPEGIWVPKFLKTPVKKMLFDEASWEPIYNRGDPLLNPAKLYNIRSEKFTEMGAKHALLESEKALKKAGALNPTIVYILIGLVLAAVGGLGWFLITRLSEIEETLNKLAQALGVG